VTRPVLTSIVIAAVILVGAAIAIVVRLAEVERSAPARCPAGLVALGARCCGDGQKLAGGRCIGAPKACALGMRPTFGARPGCVAEERRIRVVGGTLQLSPSDWEAQRAVGAREVKVRGFSIDSSEVTLLRWQACTSAGTCPALRDPEPGRPVTAVTPDDAERFCRFSGGRLPTTDEWLMAAAGSSGRRFSWGPNGLVCRRAAFGLVAGPCADGAEGPELAGSRPDGATPEGLFDLTGNVAEWTRDRDGKYVALGGSYRSKVAAELATWAIDAAQGPAPHIGFRCAYAS
jgi:formylglycine-generating enzyme required for sulfatase activity